MEIIIKKIGKTSAIISVVLFAAIFLFHDRCPDKPRKMIPIQETAIEEEIYRPPIIKIPFITKDRQPIKDKDLPIPKKDIAKTIEIIQPKSKEAVVIIDKKGKIYKSKDTPKEVEIKVTTWKPRLFEVKPQVGFTGALTIYPLDLYPCLSLDILRIWKLYFGGDLGVKIERGRFTDVFYGIAARYMILPKNNIFATAGWEFKHKTIYIGLTLRF